MKLAKNILQWSLSEQNTVSVKCEVLNQSFCYLFIIAVTSPETLCLARVLKSTFLFVNNVIWNSNQAAHALNGDTQHILSMLWIHNVRLVRITSTWVSATMEYCSDSTESSVDRDQPVPGMFRSKRLSRNIKNIQWCAFKAKTLRRWPGFEDNKPAQSFRFEAIDRSLSPIDRLGVKTLRTHDTSDPRHFGTSAEVSIRHFGTSAELSGHFGTSAEMSWDTSALRKILRHCATLDGKVDECLRNTVN